MLSPEELRDIADTMYPKLDILTTWITKDVISRLVACLNRKELLSLGATDKWQLMVYQAAAGHYDALTAEIRRWTSLADDEIRQIFEAAGIKAWESDAAFYRSHGIEPVPILKDKGLMRVLTDCYLRTAGEVSNFCQTIAGASQLRFISVCDDAHLKVMSGAQSYTAAMVEAVNELAQHQLKVKYPSGHVDTIETAVLRCIRTGTAQASGNMTIQSMKDNGWDLIRVSAHIGARYGDGGENPGNHFWWQGKLYSLSGTSDKYPNFAENTGYGTGDGLSGWNCRHSFGPGDPDHNPFKNFDAEKNKKAYDLSQQQRSMERAIRKTKHKLVALESASDACTDDDAKEKLKEDYNRTNKLLGEQNRVYQDFCDTNGLRVMSDRLHTAKWGREEARKSVRIEADMRSFNETIMRANITSTGVPITEVSAHVYTRAKFRGLTAEDIADALTNPLDLGTIRVDRSQQFLGRKAIVPINVDTGKVATVWPMKEKTLRKLLRKKGLM